MTERKKYFLLLQVNDALFPIGGYSHSQGLETYIQKGIVHDVATAETYLHRKLIWGLAHTELLAVRMAYERGLEGQMEALEDLEDLLDVSRLPAEQRDASRKMGSRFMKTLEKLECPELSESIFGRYREARKGKSMNHCVVYGVFCAALELPLEDVLSHYIYAQTSAMVTNCVKSVPLSQSAGQQILYGCYDRLEEMLKQVMTWTEDDLCLSAPGFDIRGIQHEKLYSRLYMS